MASLIEQLGALRGEAEGEIAAAPDEAGLEALRVKFLGKKGALAAALRGMGALSAADRPAVGQAANEARDAVEAALAAAKARLETEALRRELSGPAIDVTLPGRRGPLGRRHPLSQTLDDIVDVFRRLGFAVAEGPHVELDWFNFEALNFPKDHPARDMQDTFFIDPASLGALAGREDVLLRTHTSPVQIRTMLDSVARRGGPPVRVIAPGSVFRCDSDPTHSPMFHQIECLYVDRGVTFADLKGTLEAFVRALFGPDRQVRLRPSFFPFVEPGAEVDVSWSTDAQGNVTKWLEILGAGMVHPNVLRAGGIDPEVYTGFAFGLGVERVAMLRHGIDDLRLLFENDVRFLEQF